MYFYTNLPIRYEFVDYFVKFDTTTHLVESVSSALYSTEGTYFNGMPTTKRNMIKGRDSANIL